MALCAAYAGRRTVWIKLESFIQYQVAVSGQVNRLEPHDAPIVNMLLMRNGNAKYSKALGIRECSE